MEEVMYFDLRKYILICTSKWDLLLEEHVAISEMTWEEKDFGAKKKFCPFFEV